MSIEIGDGWRRLEVGEIVERDDQFFNGYWRSVGEHSAAARNHVGKPLPRGCVPFRRRTVPEHIRRGVLEAGSSAKEGCFVWADISPACKEFWRWCFRRGFGLGEGGLKYIPLDQELRWHLSKHYSVVRKVGPLDLKAFPGTPSHALGCHSYAPGSKERAANAVCWMEKDQVCSSSTWAQRIMQKLIDTPDRRILDADTARRQLEKAMFDDSSYTQLRRGLWKTAQRQEHIQECLRQYSNWTIRPVQCGLELPPGLSSSGLESCCSWIKELRFNAEQAVSDNDAEECRAIVAAVRAMSKEVEQSLADGSPLSKIVQAVSEFQSQWNRLQWIAGAAQSLADPEDEPSPLFDEDEDEEEL